MKKVITYGTYDHLHIGHINLLKRAKELGDYLIVGVTTENFDVGRGKMSVQQSLLERVRAVQETGYADLVIPEEYLGQKIDDILKYEVDIFAIGSDWEGHFDYLKEFCDVVYLERTKGISSTQIRSKNNINIGIVGYLPMVDKFISECKFINELNLKGIALIDDEKPQVDLPIYDSVQELLDDVQAVYVITSPRDRYKYSKLALENGKHVICESPIAFERAQAEELFELAKEKELVLFEAIKTAYSIAFNRLKTLVQSRWIGDVVSVESTCTSLINKQSRELSSFESWGPISLLPIFKILGTNYSSHQFITRKTDGNDSLTLASFVYDKAFATAKVANGVKSEGELIISGTKGYIYVPAPWWKTEYFEIRYENSNENRRYFYKLDGEGIRYELSAFVHCIKEKRKNVFIDNDITLKISELMNEFCEGNNMIEI